MQLLLKKMETLQIKIDLRDYYLQTKHDARDNFNSMQNKFGTNGYRKEINTKNVKC